MEEALPIILSMNVHCHACSRMICGSIISTYTGLDGVSASPRTDLVQVRGGARIKPSGLRWFLQQIGEARHASHGGGASMKRRRVIVVNHGGRPQHLAPTPTPPSALLLGVYPPPPPPPYYPDEPSWLRQYVRQQTILRPEITVPGNPPFSLLTD